MKKRKKSQDKKNTIVIIIVLIALLILVFFGTENLFLKEKNLNSFIEECKESSAKNMIEDYCFKLQKIKISEKGQEQYMTCDYLKYKYPQTLTVAPIIRCNPSQKVLEEKEFCDNKNIGDNEIVNGQTCRYIREKPEPNLAKCGNGLIDIGEECDLDNFGLFTCKSLGYSGGTLRCGSDCQFDVSKCIK